jgi:hypothetical protein
MIDVEKNVDSAINRLIVDFERVPNKYLTEDDVRMHLCTFLLEFFGEESRTEDDDVSIPLHCEVRWYGPEEIGSRTDIVVFDVAGFSVVGDSRKSSFYPGRSPRKGYASSTPVAAIELKLRRNNGRSEKAFKESVFEDCKKLDRVKSMITDHYAQDLVCRVVALDKKEKIEEWAMDHSGIQILYRHADRASNGQ